ncbi:hypothetical protein Tco_1244554 [Tanacetum coccineum]
MDDETTADEQAYSSGDEVGRDHIPTVNLRQSWWKPLNEDRPATPEPAWNIPSSDLTMPINNWASALKLTYAPPQENSLLAQTGDMAMFMDWYNVSKPLPLSGEPGHVGRPALSISKMKAAYYPDVGLEQLVPDQFWIEEECKYDIAAMYDLLEARGLKSSRNKVSSSSIQSNKRDNNKASQETIEATAASKETA